jgi:NAD(P)H-hydrate epimerase
MLLQAGHTVSVYILAGEKRSEDFCINLERIKPSDIDLNFIDNTATVIIKKDAVLIDALFGTGLNRPLQGFAADLVGFINDTGRPTY